MCGGSPTASAIPRILLEVWIHQLLSLERRSVSLIPILGCLSMEDKNVIYDDHRPPNRKSICMTGLSVRIGGSDYHSRHHPSPRFLSPSSDDRLSHCWFFTPRQVDNGTSNPFVFQITHNADKHDVGQVGVGVDRSDVHQYTHKFLAVITPTGVSSWVVVLYNR